MGSRKPKMYVGKKKTKARSADKHVLYERSVQNPEGEVDLLDQFYRDEFRKKSAGLFREDFSGTFAVCCEWVKRHPESRALAIDLDKPTLDWGRENNLGRLEEDLRAKVEVVEGNVLDLHDDKADIVAAMNFSYQIFKTRKALGDYFKSVYNNLGSEGIFALDTFGGYETFEDDKEEDTEHDAEDGEVEFTYVWDQHRFDPITRNYQFHIHFEFPDGSRMEKAFSYDWRMWTIPEIRELLEEAGFAASHVYWEDTDEESGEGNGEYRRRSRGDADPAWVSYIVAVKR